MKQQISNFIKKYKIEKALLLFFFLGGIVEYLPLNVIAGVNITIYDWIYSKLFFILISLGIGLILSNWRFILLSFFLLITIFSITQIQIHLSHIIVEVNRNVSPKEQKGVFLGVYTEIIENELVVFHWSSLETGTMLVNRPNHGFLSSSEREILTVIDKDWYLIYTPFLE